MTDQLSFKTICEGSASKLDVIFVHGLTGNCSDTWTSNDGIADVYWPQWLCEDFQVGVYAIGYTKSKTQTISLRRMRTKHSPKEEPARLGK